MDRYFGQSGILSGLLPGYEPRGEQEQMSAAIANALANKEHLIVEAGTGVGKSLAYLIPLIEHVLSEDGMRAVVSTYTKALQHQLVEKELPFLRDVIFKNLKFALCIGSENYLCLRRMEQAKTHGLFDADETEPMGKLNRWVRKTSSGMKSEIEIPPRLWQKVCRESDLCFGKECKRFSICFYQKAKEIERKAHILVTNHHLFFANIASGGNVIPSFGSVVFDEAHELEDVAADYLGTEISNFKLRHLLDSLVSLQGKGLLLRLPWLSPSAFSEASGLVNTARIHGEVFFQEVSAMVKDSATLRIREKGIVRNNLSGSLIRCADALKRLGEISRDEDEQKEITTMALRAESLALSLQMILDQEMDNHVYWAERDSRRVRLVATPLDIAAILKIQVFDTVAPAILTSATLTVNKSFDYLKDRLGLEEARTLLLNSPFDYLHHAALYIPDHIREPNAEGFEDDLIRNIHELLSITMGRTMVLFTSYHLLTKVRNAITIPGLELIAQGERDNYRLLQLFRENSHSVLFGTYTFWQGIDIPGDDLQCVIITKLPFAVPDNPVIEGRMEALLREGINPFLHYQVPQAAILLKQGFGRLIRTKTDRGAVAILDPRIRTKAYGIQFLKSLPECTITASRDDIVPFVVRDRAGEGKQGHEPGECRGAWPASPVDEYKQY
jgi:ATP-dependent DNA helicase DinG